MSATAATKTKIKLNIGDLVIMDTGFLGKIAYRVLKDIIYIRLENIDNGYEYSKFFDNLEELESFIEKNSHVMSVVSLR